MRIALALLAVSFALYAWTLDHFFVSDDFLNFERNGFRTVADALGFFSTADIDFYRPIPRLHFGVLQGLVGDRALGWNVLGVLLHAGASVAAYHLAASLLGRKRPAALLTGLVFAVHFVHVEAVVWASGVTSVYVTLFVLATIVAFRRARETGSIALRTLSVACLAAALLSKETAVAFVPLLLLTTAWRPPVAPGGTRTPRWPTPGEALPYAILLAAWAFLWLQIDRGGEASPYRIALGANVLKNAAFFLLAGFVPVRYWRVQDLWAEHAGSGLAAFTGGLLAEPALSVPLALGALALLLALGRGSAEVRAGLAWVLLAAAPFLLLPGSGERFAYLPSFGACLVLGVAGEALLRRQRRLPGGRWTARVVVVAGLAVLVGGSLDRQHDWKVASGWTEQIVRRWAYLRALDPEEPIEFLGVPDEYRSAWVFRNGFDSMVRLFWEGRPYAREGELPPGNAAAERMVVVPRPPGTVGMMPERLWRQP